MFFFLGAILRICLFRYEIGVDEFLPGQYFHGLRTLFCLLNPVNFDAVQSLPLIAGLQPTMAEIVGTTIGVVGFLAQLFDGCVKAYGYFTVASNLDTDSQRMMCKVRIEEMRLVVWGREWGVAEGSFEAHLLSERNPQLRALATQVLEELHATVTDFRKLQERYGLINEGSRTGNNGDGLKSDMKVKGGKDWDSPPSSSKGFKDEGRKLNGSKSSLGSEKSWRKEFSLKTKWVIAGE